MTAWPLRVFRGAAGELHARTIGDDPEAAVWALEVDRPAIVLGSTQREEVVDRAACDAAGVAVVRRRSGGGLVLVEPGDLVWFDVVVPTAVLRAVGAGDDVVASMTWLGRRLVEAMPSPPVPGGLTVHDGPMSCSAWCPLVCFAGVGPGEVLADGVKLVGVSQRRTRAAARFQCAVHVRWSPSRLVGLLAADLDRPAADLPPVATVAPGVAASLPAAVAASLPG